MPDYFALQSFRVLAERRVNARGPLIAMSEATVKLGGRAVSATVDDAIVRRGDAITLEDGRVVAKTSSPAKASARASKAR